MRVHDRPAPDSRMVPAVRVLRARCNLGLHHHPATPRQSPGTTPRPCEAVSADRRLRPFKGWPSTSWPLSAEFPRSSQYATLLRHPWTLLAISCRAARVSTQPITISKLETSVCESKCSVTAVQFRPQNRFSRLTITTALARPISAEQKGWRTQFVAEMTSPSMTVTCSPPG